TDSTRPFWRPRVSALEADQSRDCPILYLPRPDRARPTRVVERREWFQIPTPSSFVSSRPKRRDPGSYLAQVKMMRSARLVTCLARSVTGEAAPRARVRVQVPPRRAPSSGPRLGFRAYGFFRASDLQARALGRRDASNATLRRWSHKGAPAAQINKPAA